MEENNQEIKPDGSHVEASHGEQTPPVQNPNPEQTVISTPPRIKSKNVILIAIILIILVLTLVGSVVVLSKFKSQQKSTNSVKYTQKNLPPPPPSNPTPTIIPTSDSNVTWLPQPIQSADIHPMSMFDKYEPFSITYCTEDAKNCNLSLTAQYETKTIYYKVGTMKSIYPGAAVYLALVKNMPRGTTLKGIDTLSRIENNNNLAYLFIKTDNSYILTKDYSSSGLVQGFGSKFPPNELVFRNDIILDPSIYLKVLPNGQASYTTNLQTFGFDFSNSRVPLTHPIDFFDQGNLTKVYDFQDGHVLYSDQNLASGSDTVGHVFFPDLNLRLPTNLWSSAGEYISLRPNGSPTDPNVKNADITWRQGAEPPGINPLLISTNPYSANQIVAKGYTNALSGCLAWPEAKNKFANALAENINISNLTPVGNTDSGGILYDINNKNLAIFKSVYDFEFPTTNQQGDKITFDSFMLYKPILLYKEATGEYLAVFREDLYTQWCAGEPVIYLYPTQKTNVTVGLSNKISLTQSSPLYKNIWNVVASPDGLIIDPTTNNLYHHLYWEGEINGAKNPVSDEVIAKKDIHSYFEKSLRVLGLNTQEINDFEAYWEPQLKNDSYYRLLFYDAQELNKDIPLNIDPKPDTMIRILMDHYALTSPQISKNPLGNYPIPQRNGFILVEWGGILH